jgi:hypothetical protein
VEEAAAKAGSMVPVARTAEGVRGSRGGGMTGIVDDEMWVGEGERLSGSELVSREARTSSCRMSPQLSPALI